MMSHIFSQFLPSLQLTLHEAAQTRLRHTTTALSLEPGRTRIILFGGCPKWQWKILEFAQQKIAKTTVLEFGEQNTHVQSWLSFFLISYLPLFAYELVQKVFE